MERLTERLRTGEVLMASDYEEKYTEQEWICVLQDRLAAYEDTGLTPEEVAALVKDWSDLCTIVGECGGIDRMRELAEADKDGRQTISEYRVKAIRVELFCTFIEWDIVAGFVDKSIFGVPVDEIGKTVFLTREEAEKALEAMKDD